MLVYYPTRSPAAVISHVFNVHFSNERRMIRRLTCSNSLNPVPPRMKRTDSQYTTTIPYFKKVFNRNAARLVMSLPWFTRAFQSLQHQCRSQTLVTLTTVPGYFPFVRTPLEFRRTASVTRLALTPVRAPTRFPSGFTFHTFTSLY